MNMRILTLILLIAGGCMWGCKKSKSSAPVLVMNAKINGQAFEGTSTSSSISGTRLTISGGVAGGTDPGYPRIVLSAGNYTGAGTYDLGSNANYGAVDSSFINSNQVIYGTLIITSVDPAISGTFSFTCFDSTKVTDGTFSCPKL